MREKCVSVIVPIYNSDEFLDKCIQSIINQSYTNLQIILVNDGSNDNSRDICDRYAMKDSKIEVYHLENRGVSNTRNFALTKVRGNYIQFVDSDDYLLKNMTKIMVDKLEKTNSDIAVCNYNKVFRNMMIPNMKCDKPGIYTNKEYLCKTLSDAGHHYYGVVWNKLYRRNIIDENKIVFDKNVSLGEDFIFNINYWLKCQKVVVLGKHLYQYNKSNSTTLSQCWHKRIEDCQSELENRQHIYRNYKKAFETLGIYDTYEEDILFYWIVFYVRQKISLKIEYVNWTEEEKKIWNHQIENDTDIKKSLQEVSKSRMIRYSKKYQLENKIKCVLKKWGGLIY